MKNILKANEAKQQLIWFVNENGFSQEESLFDFVYRFEDENKLGYRLYEDYEIDEETGKIVDFSKYRIYFNRVNRASEYIHEEFDSEEEAEDYLFNAVFNHDFQANKTFEISTEYFESEEEAEDSIIELIADTENIDKNVAESYFNKKKLVYKRRAEYAKIHREKINAENAKRNLFISENIGAEIESIAIDDNFKMDMEAAAKLQSKEKSRLQELAFSALLKRNNVEIKTDFWQVFRSVKNKLSPLN
jgi:hypothetical protein